MVLSNKQRDDLHGAILDFLTVSGFTEAAAKFQEEAKVANVEDKHQGMLEKKWTSVLRQQKKILDLERKVTELEGELKSGGRLRNKQKADGIPRPPAIHTLKGHRAPLTAVRFHPIFSQLASSSEDATVKIWDYDSGELERTLKGHTNVVQDVAFDHSGNILASCSADLSIKLWNMGSTFECMKTLKGHDHNVSSVVFFPSGDFLLSCSRDKTIKQWEVSTGYCVRTLEGHDEWVRRVIVSEDGQTIASCSHDQTVRIWNAGTGNCTGVLREHTHVVECIAFSPANIVSLDQEGRTKRGAVPMGTFVASGARDKTIRIWEVNTAQCLFVLEGHDNWVREVIFHPNGKHLISCSDDKTVRIWDLAERRCVKTINDAHTHFISCAHFNNKDPHLATGSVDNELKV
eukprot:CAMPEP_0114608990 /NCGR_PEP_ID=MMETSP0168-20121206/2860_1 /TAXON_ID=95228 ORGANISM="Vannella sp., Strain DIVA3 517/6/12" /NCGR_SAMPLE_ID=MMETSP0168 /ASSEMBLY_ACC=CAM_ASM_000044 /LENGTH=402 /DNA_ID=CAMNT_0001819899 /DNA_START=92 /DNA_END=1297 /DNA_ORIENTATION=-